MELNVIRKTNYKIFTQSSLPITGDLNPNNQTMNNNICTNQTQRWTEIVFKPFVGNFIQIISKIDTYFNV
jgi:hypothetical protein